MVGRNAKDALATTHFLPFRDLQDMSYLPRRTDRYACAHPGPMLLDLLEPYGVMDSTSRSIAFNSAVVRFLFSP